MFSYVLIYNTIGQPEIRVQGFIPSQRSVSASGQKFPILHFTKALMIVGTQDLPRQFLQPVIEEGKEILDKFK